MNMGISIEHYRACIGHWNTQLYTNEKLSESEILL